MKNNTKKLLLWLFQPDQAINRQVSANNLHLILPDLKKSGLRSLLNLLKNQQLLIVEDGIRLSAYGRKAVEAQFPALNTSTTLSTGNWKIITFIEAPSNDKQFRYLRQLLLNSHCGQVARGTYIYPGELPTEVMNILHRLYVGKVMVTGLKSWDFGDEHLVVDKIFGLHDLKSGYSGISKEIYLLLRRINRQKSIEDKDKIDISLAFDRLADLLSVDLGLLQHYFPEEKSGTDLLAQLQSLLE